MKVVLFVLYSRTNIETNTSEVFKQLNQLTVYKSNICFNKLCHFWHSGAELFYGVNDKLIQTIVLIFPIRPIFKLSIFLTENIINRTSLGKLKNDNVIMRGKIIK